LNYKTFCFNRCADIALDILELFRFLLDFPPILDKIFETELRSSSVYRFEGRMTSPSSGYSLNKLLLYTTLSFPIKINPPERNKKQPFFRGEGTDFPSTKSGATRKNSSIPNLMNKSIFQVCYRLR